MKLPVQTALDLNESKETEESTVKPVAGRAWYGWIVAALALFAGVAAAIDPTTLLKPWPFVAPPGSKAATIFWVCLLAWSVLYFYRENAKSQEFDRMHAIARLIKETVQTLPPAMFVRLFNRMTTDSRCRPVTASDKAKIEETIRVLLGMVASLAKAYDDRREVRYAANVMVFVPRRKNAPYFPNLDEEKIRQFLPLDFGLEFLDGVLLLDPALSSIALENKAGVQDDGIDKVIFGIRTHYFNDKKSRWTVLPGAAMAFTKWNHAIRQTSAKPGELLLELRQAVQGCDDIRELVQAIGAGIDGEQFELEEHVLDQIKAFYSAAGQKVRSFQAYPLVKGNGTLNAFAVLNIHCDKKIFLGDVSGPEARNRQRTFAGVVSPMVFDIALAVSQWWELTRSTYV